MKISNSVCGGPLLGYFLQREGENQGSDMDRREILWEKWQLTDLSTKVPKSRQYLTTTLQSGCADSI